MAMVRTPAATEASTEFQMNCVRLVTSKAVGQFSRVGWVGRKRPSSTSSGGLKETEIKKAIGSAKNATVRTAARASPAFLAALCIAGLRRPLGEPNHRQGHHTDH